MLRRLEEEGTNVHSGANRIAQATTPAIPTRAASSRLRILTVVDGYYPSTGGAELQAGLISRALANDGHRVSIVAPRLEAHRPLREDIDSIPVERIAYPRVRVLGAVVLCLKFAWRLYRNRREYDAIHVHMAKNLASVAGLLRPILKRPVVVKISGAWEFEGGILDPALRSKLYVRLMNACIRRVDCLQCISSYTRLMLVKAGYPEDRIRMIPNAVDLERFRFANPGDEAPNVLFVGRVEPVKGLDILLDAWPMVRNRVAATLVIAGDGSMLQQLKQQAKERAIENSVRFLGNVSNVADWLASSSVYVQPSHQEGLPNSVLEAMAAGLPIVATRVSGNEDLVIDKRNGRLVPPGRPELLAAALIEVLSDRERARTMGRESRRVIEEQYQMRVILDGLTRAYRGEG